jgi:hypothetical protein
LQEPDLADLSVRNKEHLYEELCIRGIPPNLGLTGTTGGECDIIGVLEKKMVHVVDWQECFSAGLRIAVNRTVVMASGTALGSIPDVEGWVRQAKNWFITKFPLLGALAASFKIYEDQAFCNRMQIRVAAVNMEAHELYINPAWAWTRRSCVLSWLTNCCTSGYGTMCGCRGRDPDLLSATM